VNISEYFFTIDGMVDNPLHLSYSELKDYPSETRVVLLICPRTFADNPSWTGIPLAAILAKAGAGPEASEIVLRSLDGFEIPLPIDIAPDILLAYQVDGAMLPPVHGYPLRAVITGRIGLYWLRWLKEIEVR
jgi:DMSO/TMAO reductase YedYZ molybdopterin-dependent catalytic subunit